MNAMKENVCRLCLNRDKDFEAIGYVTRDMFDVLSLEMNMDISRDPIICKQCMKITKKCYYFKLVCRNAEKSAINKRKFELDFRPIYGSDKNVKIAVDQESTRLICRFCMVRFGKNDFISDVLLQEPIFPKMFPILLPEINLNIVKNPVICAHCKENLQCYFKFVQKCLDIEEKIKEYCRGVGMGINSARQITLSEIGCKPLFNNAVRDVDTHSEAYSNFIKTEVLDIKDEVDFDENVYEIPSEGNIYIKNDPIKNYRCATCRFQTNYKNTFKNHVLTCSKRNVKFFLKAQINTHNRFLVVLYTCRYCTYKTKRKTDFKTHMLIHYNSSEVKQFKCGNCTFATKHHSSLTNHLLMHKDTTKIIMYRCGMCAYETKWKGNLKKHVSIHKVVTQ